MRTTSWSLSDLALDGVYIYFEFLQIIVVSYTTISPLPEGGILSVALSIVLKKLLSIKEHPVLQCPDFPLKGYNNKLRATIRSTQTLKFTLIFSSYKNLPHISQRCIPDFARISVTF